MARILLIDDDDLSARLLSVVLGNEDEVLSIEDWEADGASAMEGAPYDLVLVDVNMPRLDGRVVAGDIKASSPASKVYLYSGMDRAELQRLAESLGLDGGLQKSGDLDVVRESVARALAR